MQVIPLSHYQKHIIVHSNELNELFLSKSQKQGPGAVNTVSYKSVA